MKIDIFDPPHHQTPSKMYTKHTNQRPDAKTNYITWKLIPICLLCDRYRQIEAIWKSTFLTHRTTKHHPKSPKSVFFNTFFKFHIQHPYRSQKHASTLFLTLSAYFHSFSLFFNRTAPPKHPQHVYKTYQPTSRCQNKLHNMKTITHMSLMLKFQVFWGWWFWYFFDPF